MNIDYTGKSIVITGAGGGIGDASARLFASLGGKVVAVDFNAESLNATVDSINASGGTAIPVVADVTEPEEVDKFIDTALQEYGNIWAHLRKSPMWQPTWHRTTPALSMVSLYQWTEELRQCWRRPLQTKVKGT